MKTAEGTTAYTAFAIGKVCQVSPVHSHISNLLKLLVSASNKCSPSPRDSSPNPAEKLLSMERLPLTCLQTRASIFEIWSRL